MLRLFRGERKSGPDIFRLKVRKIGEDLRLADPTSKQIQDVFNPNAHTPDARAAAALVGIERYAIHVANLNFTGGSVKTAGCASPTHARSGMAHRKWKKPERTASVATCRRTFASLIQR